MKEVHCKAESFILITVIFVSRPIDVWAVGCLLVELLTGDPIFPGDSDLDQLNRIIKVFGTSQFVGTCEPCFALCCIGLVSLRYFALVHFSASPGEVFEL